MGYARYVGRIGALAVALGIGVWVGNAPGVALADETGSSTASSTTDSSHSTTSSTGTDAGSAGVTVAEGTPAVANSAEPSRLEKQQLVDSSVSTDSTVRKAPPGQAISTSGKTSKKSDADTAAADNPAAGSSKDPEPVAPASVLGEDSTTSTAPKAPALIKAPVHDPKTDSDQRTQQVDRSPSAPAVQASRVAFSASAAPSRGQVSELAPTLVDVALDEHVAQQTVSAFADTSPSLEQPISIAAPAISAASEEPTHTPSDVSVIVLGLLASLGPLATDGPVPFDSPLGLALMAVGTRPRQFGQPVAEEMRSLPASSTLTSQAIDTVATADQQTFAAMATAADANSAPYLPPQPDGKPDAVTGVVTGTVTGTTDPDGDTLTYTVTGATLMAPSTWATAKGTVTLDPATGAYTYTPTQAARLVAYTTSGLDTDTFTVAVSDGQATATAPVSVYVSPAQYQNQTPITVGTSPSGVVVSPDGTRMYVANTGSGTVSVIDTTTGKLIDTNPKTSTVDSIKVGSSPTALALSGTRLYVANTGSGTVSVIDTATYQRIDADPTSRSMDIRVGSSPSALAISGNRLYVANTGSGTVSVIDTTTNRLIDTDTNVIGTQSITVGSSPSALAISGTGLYVANRGSNTVSVIDTTTNRLIDTNPNVSGTQSITVGSSPSALAISGNRLYVANTASGTVSVIDTTTYQRIDADPTSSSMDIRVGSSPGAVAFSPDGSLAYVANGNDTVSVINTKDYTVFATITIDPNAETTGGHAIALSPDGTRVYVTDAVDRTVRVIALGRFTNTAPVVSGDTIPSAPDPVTGLVTGVVNVRDPDQDQLRYTLAEPPAMGGTVTFDQQTGAFGYTPSQAARDQAAATSELDYDTFGVYVSDGISTTYTPVRVQVAPTPAPTAPVTNTPVTVGSGPSGSVVSGGYAYVINYDSNNVTVIDAATNQIVTTLDVGAGPLSVAANPQRNRVYVSNSLDNTVSVIDTGTNQVIGTIPIQVLPGSFYNPEISYYPIDYENRVTEVAAFGNRLYVNSTDGRITVIDTTNIDGRDANTVIRADSLGTFTDLKLSPDGTRLYGTSGTSLTVINTSTMTPVSVHVGPTWDPNNDFRNEYTTSIGNVALSPDGKRAYVTYGVTIAERGVGGQTSGYFFTDSQGRSWMVTGGYSAVAVFDTDPQSPNYNKQIATIIVPAGVQDVAVSPDNSRLYVTSGDGKTVTVIDTTNNAIVGTFTTDQTSSGGRAIYVPFDWYPLYNVAAFTQYITVGEKGTVYVTDYTDGTLYVITVGDPTIL